MKTKIYYITLFSLFLSLSSCLVDNDVASDLNDKGPNLVGFNDNEQSANALADGSTLDVSVPVSALGPTSMGITEDITITYEVDASSTAVEGTHYILEGNSLTLSSEMDLESSIPVTIITEGIIPPLETAPTLVINITSTTGDNIVVSGRTGQVTLTINYLCFSNLAGDYYISYSSGNQTHTVTEISDGYYEISSMFGWPTGGYTVYFTDVCGDLTLINDWQFSNEIGGTGVVDPDTGNLIWSGTFVENVYSDLSWTMVKIN